MDHDQRLSSARATILLFRRERERSGLHCPHCDSNAVIRWGSFSGRRRYRCRSCPRTFSDLTHTAVAHLKRIDVWLTFCEGVESVETVRAGAKRLGVDPATTFRWRHRLLSSLCRTDDTALEDTVTVGTAYVPYSRKGLRGAPQRPIEAVDAHVFGVLSVGIIAACAVGGAVWAAKIGLRRPTQDDLRQLLEPRLDPASVLVSREGRYGVVASFAAGSNRRWRQWRNSSAAGPGDPDVYEYVWLFKRWVRRFRGIASRYLDHYLVWHRLRVVGRRRPELVRRAVLLARYLTAGA